MGFRNTLKACAAATCGISARARHKAAMSLPQTPERQIQVGQADGIVRDGYAAESWASGVTQAAATLRGALASGAIEVRETGKPARHPVEDAARALLAALGEQNPV